MNDQEPTVQSRRDFVKTSLQLVAGGALLGSATACGGEKGVRAPVELEKFRYAFLVNIEACIGCGNCVQACREENKVPEGSYRTWIERYTVHTDGQVDVDSPAGGEASFPPSPTESEPLRSFFVPKLCNQCTNTPCVQVCPVGATFVTQDGFVLIDRDRCIGCAYCIHSCPYGARYIHPELHVADKCTWCYHRIVRGERPACVDACPVGARVFGDSHNPDNPIDKLKRERAVNVLKGDLGTNPKTQYVGLSKEVR